MQSLLKSTLLARSHRFEKPRPQCTSTQRSDSDWPGSSKCHAHKKLENRARNVQESPRSVCEELADSSDLDLDQCLLEGQNQIFLEILSATGTKSLKKD